LRRQPYVAQRERQVVHDVRRHAEHEIFEDGGLTARAGLEHRGPGALLERACVARVERAHVVVGEDVR
jgi:hypothetical protein